MYTDKKTCRPQRPPLNAAGKPLRPTNKRAGNIPALPLFSAFFADSGVMAFKNNSSFSIKI
jgi:hypothetical protein